MTIPIQLDKSILDYFSVGGVWQNILFYATILCLFYINILLTRRKKNYKLQPVGDLPDEKDESALTTADSAGLKTNVALNKEIATLRNELLALGEKLELSYMKSERLNGQLSEILDSVELTMVYDHTLWDWSLDFSSKEITLSEYGLKLFGFPENTKPILNEAIHIVDPRHQAALMDAVEKSFNTGADFSITCLVHPLNGSQSKEIKAAGRVYYNEYGTPLKLSGKFSIMHTEPVAKR
ncbi:hypothetical protein [Mucilaginibacter rubeus]|uniref:hypothetical protein n=1 Tax=Mucilaginibacter rubeus TaxID=2027860 RepID=UPI00166DA230|nr:hypothetical protein [Mucilaginibacter rubeus]GGB17664.1 hypothetical protein GCM10011500_37150 [Mucilaginibacter rubeus]